MQIVLKNISECCDKMAWERRLMTFCVIQPFVRKSWFRCFHTEQETEWRPQNGGCSELFCYASFQIRHLAQYFVTDFSLITSLQIMKHLIKLWLTWKTKIFICLVHSLIQWYELNIKSFLKSFKLGLSNMAELASLISTDIGLQLHGIFIK